MLHFFNYKKDRKSKPSGYREKLKKKKIMLLSKCVVCNIKKSRFIKKQETSWLLNILGLKSPLSKILLLHDFLI